MANVLIIEESSIVRAVFAKLLDESAHFSYDLAASYSEAAALLESKKYDYAVAERLLSDAGKGEIIALLNKHDIAPLLFTKEIDEEFFESFEGASIIDYMIKQKYNNVTVVIKRLIQLEQNKTRSLALYSSNTLFANYLIQNLNLHKFEVFLVQTPEALFETIQKHSGLELLIMDEEDSFEASLELLQSIRKIRSSEELKILSLQAKSASFELSTLLNSGVDDYLITPFSRTEFYLRVYQNIN